MNKFYLFFCLGLLGLLPSAVNAQTVNMVTDTAFNSDQSIAYIVNATVLSEPGKNTMTLNITEGTSAISEIFDMDIYRDVDARLQNRERIARSVAVPTSGTFIFEDEHAEWLNDGGGDYGYTGAGELPALTPFFYSIKFNRMEEFGGAARPRRSYPAIDLPNPPTDVIQDVINDDMTLVTQTFPIQEDTSVILKLDFAPDYSYFQQVLSEALPGEPLYPAGDKPIFFAKVYLNPVADPNGRTDIEYGNLYWGHEGSAYAKFSVAPEFIGEDGKTYVWLTSGRPGHDTTTPIPVDFDFVSSVEDLTDVELSVYPNPTSGLLNVNVSEGIEYISVCTLAGQRVFDQALNGTSTNEQLDLSGHPAGMYLLQLQLQGKSITKKIILE